MCLGYFLLHDDLFAKFTGYNARRAFCNLKEFYHYILIFLRKNNHIRYFFCNFATL